MSHLRRGVALHFPALACQQGARHRMLATGVIRHLWSRQPERFGRFRQAQTMFRAPTNELNGIGPPVLLSAQSLLGRLVVTGIAATPADQSRKRHLFQVSVLCPSPSLSCARCAPLHLQPSPPTPACADTKDMFDWQQSRADWHPHENLLGLELANDDATEVFYGFLQVFQQRISMRFAVSDNTVF